jgi:hypothetical protein
MQYKSFYKLLTGGSKLHFVAGIQWLCSRATAECRNNVKLMDVDVQLEELTMCAITKVNLYMECLQIMSLSLIMMLECY